MALALPEGQAPFAILPRFTVPGKKGEAVDKPDLGTFEEANVELIREMMIAPIDRHQLKTTFNFRNAFYFVDLNFNRLNNNRAAAYEALKESVDGFSQPSQNDIAALSERKPLALPALLKLAFAFEVARTYNHRGVIGYFGLDEANVLDPAIKGPMIVPALRSVVPEDFKAVRVLVGGSDLGYQGFIRSLERADRGDRRANTLELLEMGYITGKRRGYYLLTDACAEQIYGYLSALAQAKGVKIPSLDALFPNDPERFPGGGNYCTPLPIAAGNYLR